MSELARRLEILTFTYQWAETEVVLCAFTEAERVARLDEIFCIAAKRTCIDGRVIKWTLKMGAGAGSFIFRRLFMEKQFWNARWLLEVAGVKPLARSVCDHKAWDYSCEQCAWKRSMYGPWGGLSGAKCRQYTKLLRALQGAGFPTQSWEAYVTTKTK